MEGEFELKEAAKNENKGLYVKMESVDDIIDEYMSILHDLSRERLGITDC